MRVRLLKPYKGRKAGTEFVPAWDSEARGMVARGEAVPVHPVPPAESAAIEKMGAAIQKVAGVVKKLSTRANPAKPKPAKTPKPAKQ